jgi:hypothetical protein
MASEPTVRDENESPRRLWFGLSTAFFCWFLLGIAEMFITWRACLHNEQFGQASSNPAAMAAAFAVSGFLLAVTAFAGFTSYRIWRRLSAERHVYEGEGRGRREYMALLGVLVSFTLGVGMVWMLLPLFILQYCLRMR